MPLFEAFSVAQACSKPEAVIPAMHLYDLRWGPELIFAPKTQANVVA